MPPDKHNGNLEEFNSIIDSEFSPGFDEDLDGPTGIAEDLDDPTSISKDLDGPLDML